MGDVLDLVWVVSSDGKVTGRVTYLHGQILERWVIWWMLLGVIPILTIWLGTTQIMYPNGLVRVPVAQISAFAPQRTLACAAFNPSVGFFCFLAPP